MLAARYDARVLRLEAPRPEGGRQGNMPEDGFEIASPGIYPPLNLPLRLLPLQPAPCQALIRACLPPSSPLRPVVPLLLLAARQKDVHVCRRYASILSDSAHVILDFAAAYNRPSSSMRVDEEVFEEVFSRSSRSSAQLDHGGDRAISSVAHPPRVRVAALAQP